MSAATVSILEGNTFAVSDRRGDMDASPTDAVGLFHMDTRFLSKWVLTIDGQRPNLLSTDDLQYLRAQFFLVPATGTVYVDSPLSVIRKRAVGGGFHEELSILNHTAEPKDVELRIAVGSDFADLFEVKDALPKKGQYYRRVEDDRIVLGYRRELFARETWVRAGDGAELSEDADPLSRPPRAAWPLAGRARCRRRLRRLRAARAAEVRRRFEQGSARGNQPRRVARQCSQAALFAGRLCTGPTSAASPTSPRLRFFPKMLKGALAGGRPALVHGDVRPRQLHHQPAGAAVRAGAGTHDAARAGELARHPRRRLPRRGAGQDPPRAALGRDDRVRGATALALLRRRRRDAAVRVLLDEYERWTGDSELVRDARAEARAALDWIDDYADRDRATATSPYERPADQRPGSRTSAGRTPGTRSLLATARSPGFPRATCELQGYAYDAKRPRARASPGSSGTTRPSRASSRSEAADAQAPLQPRTSGSTIASTSPLALDGDGKQVDSLTSNIGHLLWSGIVDKDKANAVVGTPDGPAPVHRLGRAHPGRRRRPLQPDRLSRRHGLAVRQLVHRLGPAPLRVQGEAARIAAGILDAADSSTGGYPRRSAGIRES